MITSVNFELNGRRVQVQADAQMPLLWALRERLQLLGTKPGCLQGVCGACTVHLDGAPARACQLPLSAVAGRSVTTIEGLPEPMRQRLLTAWTEHQALQCGYCQPGQAMTAAALLGHAKAPTPEAVATALAGHLCRCGSGPRVVSAVHSALAAGTGTAS
ncbi:MAG: (2Fe-2S)-binding protein [Rhodoferax sp.]|nr:(2Fe-2S)-binding protein [Rhodoferax sp.]MBK9234780.1 (2Fe-2S)-binding protein [Rhodoferax sp.]